MGDPAKLASTEGIHGNIQRTVAAPDVLMTESLYPPNSRVSPHAHEEGCFVFILEGEYLEAVRHQEIVCGPRMVLFRPPLIEHWSSKGKAGARALFLEVSERWLNEIREYSLILSRPSLLQSAHIHTLAASMSRQWTAGSRAAPLAVEGLLYEIAADICQEKPESKEHRPKWLNTVLELLHEKFNEPLKLSDVAREVGYHPVHVTRVFRRHYGVSMGDFIRQLRIDFAREHLLRNDMPLVDVALSAGFPSQAYFSTTFKRETGLTPGQYRRAKAKMR